MTKEVIEDYINKKRQKTPRLAKDLFLLIRSVLNYAKDVRHLLNEVPKFDLKFSKKKRAKKTKIPYLTAKDKKYGLIFVKMIKENLLIYLPHSYRLV